MTSGRKVCGKFESALKSHVEIPPKMSFWKRNKIGNLNFENISLALAPDMGVGRGSGGAMPPGSSNLTFSY